MEGDHLVGVKRGLIRISTHALTWRATFGGIFIVPHPPKFLPTPSHGGRPLALGVFFWAADFYPRPHMEGDAAVSELRGQVAISTHALTWRATTVLGMLYQAPQDFYPRPHREGDCHLPLMQHYPRHFYPRPHMEGDMCTIGDMGGWQVISTHALTWRATESSLSSWFAIAYFYPRPHMEGDDVGC